MLSALAVGPSCKKSIFPTAAFLTASTSKTGSCAAPNGAAFFICVYSESRTVNTKDVGVPMGTKCHVNSSDPVSALT